jgi:hypothetical protein
MSPVAGPLFHRAAKLPVGGRKRQKVLALIAAYFDAGAVCSPRIGKMAERLGFEPVLVITLADKLVEDGWLVKLPGKKRRYAPAAWEAEA